MLFTHTKKGKKEKGYCFNNNCKEGGAFISIWNELISISFVTRLLWPFQIFFSSFMKSPLQMDTGTSTSMSEGKLQIQWCPVKPQKSLTVSLQSQCKDWESNPKAEALLLIQQSLIITEQSRPSINYAESHSLLTQRKSQLPTELHLGTSAFNKGPLK